MWADCNLWVKLKRIVSCLISFPAFLLFHATMRMVRFVSLVMLYSSGVTWKDARRGYSEEQDEKV